MRTYQSLPLARDLCPRSTTCTGRRRGRDDQKHRQTASRASSSSPSRSRRPSAATNRADRAGGQAIRSEFPPGRAADADGRASADDRHARGRTRLHPARTGLSAGDRHRRPGRRMGNPADPPTNRRTPPRPKGNNRMPTYDYECKACHHRWELFQSIKAEPEKKCPKCGKRQAQRSDRSWRRHHFQRLGLLSDRLPQLGLQEGGRSRQERPPTAATESRNRSPKTKSETKSESKKSERSRPRRIDPTRMQLGRRTISCEPRGRKPCLLPKVKFDSPADLSCLLQGDRSGRHPDLKGLSVLQRALPAGRFVALVAGKIFHRRAARSAATLIEEEPLTPGRIRLNAGSGAIATNTLSFVRPVAFAPLEPGGGRSLDSSSFPARPDVRADTRSPAKLFRWGADREGGGPYIYPDPRMPRNFSASRWIWPTTSAGRMATRHGWCSAAGTRFFPNSTVTHRYGPQRIRIHGPTGPTLRREPSLLHLRTRALRRRGSRGKPVVGRACSRVCGRPRRRIGVLAGSSADRFVTAEFAAICDISAIRGRSQRRSCSSDSGQLDATVQDLPRIAVFLRNLKRYPSLRSSASPCTGYYVAYARRATGRWSTNRRRGDSHALCGGTLRRIYEKYGLWNARRNVCRTSGKTGRRRTTRPKRASWTQVRAEVPLFFAAAGVTVLLACLSMPVRRGDRPGSRSDPRGRPAFWGATASRPRSEGNSSVA